MCARLHGASQPMGVQDLDRGGWGGLGRLGTGAFTSCSRGKMGRGPELRLLLALNASGLELVSSWGRNRKRYFSRFVAASQAAFFSEVINDPREPSRSPPWSSLAVKG